MRVLIAGASGAIGRALVRRLRANQHEVFALTQSRDSAAVLKEIGAELGASAPRGPPGGRCPGLADYVREPEGHLGRRPPRAHVLMLTTLRITPHVSRCREGPRATGLGQGMAQIMGSSGGVPRTI